MYRKSICLGKKFRVLFCTISPICIFNSAPPQRLDAHQYKFHLLTDTATSNVVLGCDTFQEDETVH